MKRTVAAMIGLVLSLTSLAAHAQEPGVRLHMDSGFYLGVGVGRSEARNFCSIGGACDAKDMAWNLFAGYQINRHFAVEGGYVDFGEATTSGFVGGVAGSLSSESTAFELLAVGLLPLSDTFSLYAKGGFFRYDSDGSGTGSLAGSSSDEGTELTFGLGAEYRFARTLAARLEWQRYLEVGSGIPGISNGDVTVLRLAARYRF